MRMHSALSALVCAGTALLAACDSAPPPPAAPPAATAAAPADPAVVRLYSQTCRGCHDPMARTGAPATGDREAWAPRLAQGMDVLVEHTIGGYRGMPPMGACMDCSEEDFAALIRYMSGQ
ncbi:MAG: c-type cytochrome [Sinimarinibacterium flocculans]|uniref:c-type cytochrome n=1 Tax=Sinimarinibacterium flocculans TaxID=985250 RepID=UPI003C37B6D1